MMINNQKHQQLLRKKLLLLVLSIVSMTWVSAQTYVSGNQSGTWTKANSPYVMTGSITVSDGLKLTIQAGVQVKSLSYDDVFLVSGILKAIGASNDSISFTGPSGSSGPGGQLRFSSSNQADSSVLAYVIIDRMGNTSNQNSTAVQLIDGVTTIRNSTFRNCGSRGIFSNVNLAVNPIVSRVLFTNVPTPAVMFANNVSGFSNNTNAIVTLLHGSFSNSNVTIPKTGTGGYYILEASYFQSDNLYQFTDCKLTINPGVEIRSYSFANRILLDGSSTLIAKGTVTDSIRFNGFSNTGLDPASTHGGLIAIQSSNITDSSVMAYVVMDRMGDKNSYDGIQAALDLRSGINILRNSSIRNCEQRGILSSAVLDVSPIVSNVSFSNTPQSAVMFANNVSGFSNNTNAVVTLLHGSFSNSNVTIPKTGTGGYYILEASYFQSDNLYQFTDCKLTINPGVEIRSYSFANRILLDGSSTLIAKGTVTDSIRFNGFSNTGLDPASTHGGLIAIQSSNITDSSVMACVVMDRMGDKDSYDGIQAALDLNSGIVKVSNCSIRNSEAFGIRGTGDMSGLSVSKTDIFKNQYGAYFATGSPAFKNCNIYNNSVYGILNASSNTLDIVDARTCWWGGGNGPKQTTTNPSGTGNPVSLQVLYKPFLTSAYVDVAVNDVGIDSIVTPYPNCSLTANEAVKIKIRNYGNVPQTGFNVSYRLNNGAIVAQNVGSLTIAGGNFAYFIFSTPANLGVGQGAIYTIQAYTSGLVSDTVRRNDTSKIIFVNNKPYVGKDTLIKLCSKGSANLNTLYNTTAYSNATWNTARPDSVGKGSYTLIVTNVFGCRDTAVATIDTISGSAITSTVTSINAGCYGGSAGSITVTPTNGIAPYQYKNGSSGAYQPANIFKLLKAGTYTIYIKDSNTCTGSTKPIVITQYQPIAATFTKTDATCLNKPDGTITVTATGGKPPYKYKLGNNGVYQDPSTFTGLKAGPYKVYIRDNAGCTGSTGFININQPPTPCFTKREGAIVDNISAASFNISLSPNPSNSAFTLLVHSDKTTPILLRVLDVNGKAIYTAKGQPDQAFRFGGEFISGVYLVELRQGDEVKTVKAIKM